MADSLDELMAQARGFSRYLLEQSKLDVASQLPAQERYEQGVTTFNLSPIDIARYALGWGDFDVFDLAKQHLSSVNIRYLLSDPEPYTAALLCGDFLRFKTLLEMDIGSNQQAKNLFLARELQYFFRRACYSGNKELLDSVYDYLGEGVLSADKAAAYQHACLSGNLELVQHLHTLLGDDATAAIKKNGYRAYQAACYSGCKELVEYLHMILQGERAYAFSQYGNKAFNDACWSGSKELVEYFHSIFEYEPVAVYRAMSYEPYKKACMSGSVELVQYLHDSLGDDAKEALKDNIYEAYQNACESGSVALVKYLHDSFGDDAKKALKAKDYTAYQKACKSGSIALVRYLNDLLRDDAKEALQADDYKAYEQACESGNVELVKYLDDLLNDDVTEALKAKEYRAYTAACMYGNVELVRHLHTLLGDDVQSAFDAGAYWSYKQTCWSGNLEVVQYFHSFFGSRAIDAFKSNNYYAYQEACYSESLPLVQYLHSFVEGNIRDALRIVNEDPYPFSLPDEELSIKDVSVAISKFLLEEPAVFSHTEAHDQEFGQSIIYEYVEAKLNRLQQLKAVFEEENPHGVFNLDEAEARYYFFILRNLIRRGVQRIYGPDTLDAEDFADDIRFLLSIPAVRSLAHQVVTVDENTPGQENELLRLALRLENGAAAAILLQIPEVNRLANQAGFYREEMEGGLDLAQIARDRESSMVALSPAEKKRVAKVKSHYQSKIETAGGLDAVFEQFKAYLKAQYDEKPATITTHDKHGRAHAITLPFDWEALQSLRNGEGNRVGLTESQYQRALQAYYQHEAHTVYRYLSKPNKWMAPNASYVYVVMNEWGEPTQERYSTFEDYKELISLFYVAAFDRDMPAIDGYTFEGREALFIKQLALIARAHNWDKSRKVVVEGPKLEEDMSDEPLYLTGKDGQVITEEYDDLKGDKPSCYSGVTRRLFQSVLGHGLLKSVGLGIVRQAVNEQVRKYFEDNIHFNNARALKEAYEGISQGEGDMDEHMKTLARLNIPSSIKEQIVQRASNQLEVNYRENYTESKQKFRENMHRYLNDASAYQPDIMAFNEELSLVALIEDRVKKVESYQTHLFFSAADKKDDLLDSAGIKSRRGQLKG